MALRPPRSLHRAVPCVSCSSSQGEVPSFVLHCAASAEFVNEREPAAGSCTRRVLHTRAAPRRAAPRSAIWTPLPGSCFTTRSNGRRGATRPPFRRGTSTPQDTISSIAAMQTVQSRMSARRVAGARVTRAAVSRRVLRVQAAKKSVGDLKEADLKGACPPSPPPRAAGAQPLASMRCWWH